MKKVAHQFFEDDGLDYEDMLSNFDDFCDQFEKRASESYNGGDPNNGRVIKEIERIGGDTPMAVREVEHPRENFGKASESVIDVQATNESALRHCRTDTRLSSQ